MSHMSGVRSSSLYQRLFSGYATLLSIPGARRFTFAVLLAGMPGPMVGMSVTIGIQHYYGSYGLAGSLTGTQAIATALIGPLLGHLVDRYGQKRVSVPAVGMWMAAAVAFVTCLLCRVPPSVYYFIMPFLAILPPWGAMCRARWAHLLAGDAASIDRSLAMCSIIDEMMWIVGNPLASILAVWSVPGAFAFTAVCVIIGAVLFLGAIGEPDSELDKARKAGMSLNDYRDSAKKAAAKTTASKSTASLLLSPAIIALCVTWFGLGAFQSATSISIISYARQLGVPQVTGFIFACFSFSSLVGVTFYGAHQWQVPLWKRFYICLAVLAVGLGSFSLITALWQVIVIYLLVGVCQGPTWVNGNQIVMRLVPTSLFTETVALMNAMNSVGSSVGSATAGHFIDIAGPHGGFLTVAALAFAAVVIAFIGFRQIKAATSHAIIGEEKVEIDG
jgi:MFS family permease